VCSSLYSPCICCRRGKILRGAWSSAPHISYPPPWLRPPFFGIEMVGIEFIEILLVFLVCHVLIVLDPFMPRRERIGAPMDEHAETGIRPPKHSLLFLRGGLMEEVGFFLGSRNSRDA